LGESLGTVAELSLDSSLRQTNHLIIETHKLINP